MLTLQPLDRGENVQDEQSRAERDAYKAHDVVPIPSNDARTPSVGTKRHARVGRAVCDDAPNGAVARGEDVDGTKDERFGQGTSEIGNRIQQLHSAKSSGLRLTVMYVPPISGSAIWVWNAQIPINCTVLRFSIDPPH